MIRIAILNKDGFYSKLLASKLNKLFPMKIKRITAFDSKDDVIRYLDKICKYDIIAIGDGICDDYPQLVKILQSQKCVANSKRFYRNKSMIDAGAHYIIPKDIVFDSYGSLGNEDSMLIWEKAISGWFS